MHFLVPNDYRFENEKSPEIKGLWFWLLHMCCILREAEDGSASPIEITTATPIILHHLIYSLSPALIQVNQLELYPM